MRFRFVIQYLKTAHNMHAIYKNKCAHLKMIDLVFTFIWHATAWNVEV